MKQGKQARVDEPTDDSDSFSLKAMWQAIENINTKLGQVAPEPATPARSIASQPAHQDEINLEMIKVLQSLKKPKDKAKDIPSTWKQTILPAITCNKIIQHNDKPEASYGERAYVKCAQVLLKMYDLYENSDSESSSDPDIIPSSSSYYEAAVTATEAIKSCAAALAFPPHTKPSDKEQKQVFQAVMGGDISAKELANAYQKKDSGGGRGGGRGRGRGGRGQQRNNKDRGRNQDKKGAGKRSASASSKKSDG